MLQRGQSAGHPWTPRDSTNLMYFNYSMIVPSRCGYFLTHSHCRNSCDKADPKRIIKLLRFQNVADLSKCIVDTYERLDSSVQYEIQQFLVESSGIPEDENLRVVSAHKSEYQHVVCRKISTIFK